MEERVGVPDLGEHVGVDGPLACGAGRDGDVDIGDVRIDRLLGLEQLGEAVDSAIFYPLAFLGAAGWAPGDVVTVMFGNYMLKVAWEVVMTPFTYRIVNFLKRAEGVDYFDRNTNFTPFSLKTD